MSFSLVKTAMPTHRVFVISMENRSNSPQPKEAPSLSIQVLGELLTPSVLAPFGSVAQTLISSDSADPGATSSKQAPGQLIPHVSCAITFICRILDDVHGAIEQPCSD